MPQYFIDKDLREGTSAVITGGDFRHLVLVRRVQAGDAVSVRSRGGQLFNGWIASIGADSLTVDISAPVDSLPALPRITLALSLIKHGNFELVLQKAVELGIEKIIPIVTERTVVDLKGKGDTKLERYRKIADEAAKQSMRATLPVVEPVRSFKSMMLSAESYPLKIITHPAPGAPTFREIVSRIQGDIPESLILVGPEGGFSPSEIESAIAAGFLCVNFGATQLRAETAGIVLPAVLMYELGERQ
jgi:16S rRNA (uracil1498-N3)-methyltransferase